MTHDSQLAPIILRSRNMSKEAMKLEKIKMLKQSEAFYKNNVYPVVKFLHMLFLSKEAVKTVKGPPMR